jgi:rhodanese-related sulfurtransferase
MSTIPTTTVTELPDDAVIVDVREADEWAAGHAPNAVHIPLSDLPARLGELPDTDDTIPIVCRSGGRSGRAVAWLAQQGFEGGMRAWHSAGKQLAGSGEPRIL